VIGTGRTWVAVPYGEFQPGQTVRTTRPAQTAYRTADAVTFTGDGYETRTALAEAPRPAVGLAIGDVSDRGVLGEVRLCLTARDAVCDPDTAVSTSSRGSTDDVTLSWPFWLSRGDRNDVVVASAGTPVVVDGYPKLAATSFLLYL